METDDPAVTVAELQRLVGDGEHAAALAVANAGIERWPNLPEFNFAAGLCHERLGNDVTAEASYREALALSAAYSPAAINLGSLLMRLGRNVDATAALDAAHLAAPADANLAARLATAYEGLRDNAAALVVLERCSAQRGPTPELMTHIAWHRYRLGETESSRNLATDAWELSAHQHGEAAALLAHLDRIGGAMHSCIDHVRDALALPGSRASLRRALHDGGIAQLHSGDPGEGLRWLERAHGLERHPSATTDSEALCAEVEREADRLRSTAPLDGVPIDGAPIDTGPADTGPADTGPADTGPAVTGPAVTASTSTHAESAPLFLVGFPRSGTTLLGTMLSSHRSIVATDEVPLLKQALMTGAERQGVEYGELAAEMSDEVIRSISTTYLDSLSQLLGPTPGQHVMDRLPANLRHLGLIAQVFPGARVVWIERDPRAVALSFHSQPFDLNRLTATAGDWQLTARLMRAMLEIGDLASERLPLEVHHVRYEDLVADRRAVLAQLLAGLGLPHDEAPFDHQQHMPVERGSTPSDAAVRSPVSSDAVHRWRRAEDALRTQAPELWELAADRGYDL